MVDQQYNIDTKNNWRRWVWDHLDNYNFRWAGSASKGGIFLLGPEPLDWLELSKISSLINYISTGHPPVIGISTNPHHVKRAREMGFTAIQGKLHELISHWPFEVSFINADLCTTVGDHLIPLLKSLINIINEQRTIIKVAINVQRGRDGLQNFGHRGDWILNKLSELIRASGWDGRMDAVLEEITRDSYKSHKVTMDTIIFKLNGRYTDQYPKSIISNILRYRITALKAVVNKKQSDYVKTHLAQAIAKRSQYQTQVI